MYAIPNVMNKVLPLLAVIDANVATNAAGIVTNAADIVTNAADIVTNTALIEAGLFADRGDSDAYDKVKTDFTTDNAWYDLDLHTIVGERKVLAVLRIYLQTATPQASIRFRTKGNSNEFNITESLVQVANLPINYLVCVETDNAGVIQYSASNVTWAVLSLLVRGLFVL